MEKQKIFYTVAVYKESPIEDLILTTIADNLNDAIKKVSDEINEMGLDINDFDLETTQVDDTELNELVRKHEG